MIDYTGNIIESVRAHLRYVERLQRTLETSHQATRDLLRRHRDILTSTPEPQEPVAAQEPGGFEEWS